MGFFTPPKDLNKFTIPILYKKYMSHYTTYSRSDSVNYLPAFTDGFYFEKDCVKYFHVEIDGEQVYKAESDLIFLKNVT